MGKAQKVVFIWPSCRNFQTSFGPPWNIVENPCCIPRHESSLAAVSYRLGPSHTVLPKCWAYKWTGVILNLCAQVQVNKNGRRKPNRFKYVLKRYKTWVYTYWIRLGSGVQKLMMRYLKEFKPPMTYAQVIAETSSDPLCSNNLAL